MMPCDSPGTLRDGRSSKWSARRPFVDDALTGRTRSREILGLAQEFSLVVDEKIAGRLTDQSAPLQFGQGSADIFARDARHCRDVALPDLVEDDDSSGFRLAAEMLRKLDQCARDARLDGQEACRYHRLIVLPK